MYVYMCAFAYVYGCVSVHMCVCMCVFALRHFQLALSGLCTHGVQEVPDNVLWGDFALTCSWKCEKPIAFSFAGHRLRLGLQWVLVDGGGWWPRESD